jgi:hypothetical protein
MDNAINNNNETPELPEEEMEGESRLQEILSSIPWGKVILGFFILFIVIWAIIYFLNRNSSSSPVVVTPTTPVVINSVDQNIVMRGADNAISKLGVADYNKILQPYFSLESPNQFSADDSRVALMQALNTLEQTVNFDLLVHLATEPSREQALNQYEQKLRTTLDQVKKYNVTLANQSSQLVITLRGADELVLTRLGRLNNVLQSGAPEAALTEAYHSYLNALRDRGVTQLEQSTLNELLRQVSPLVNQAERRLVNITDNRKALIQDVQIIDASDPGLTLIKKP